jgi:glycosyltransferase involved in cell wall biosynthesis
LVASTAGCVVSVIIATRNRAEELRTISLPSLGRQDVNDFETIVWDASGDDSSRRVAEEYAAAHPHRIVRYFKAPRAGLTAQRNDAVREARGEIVFFIDDDCEVSPNSIQALEQMFGEQEHLSAGCLRLDFKRPPRNRHSLCVDGRFGPALLSVYEKAFDWSLRMTAVHWCSMPSQEGFTDFLCGCDMAFRRNLLSKYRFEERLQKFAGYAFGEDQLLSRQLRGDGLKLFVTGKALVIHRAAVAERIRDPFNKGRVDGYNAGIMWKEGVFPYARWTVFPFLWARLGFLGVVLVPCLLRPWQGMRWKRAAGYLAGLWTFLFESVFP